MGAFLLGVLVGVIVGAIGVALTPWVKHIVPQPGRRQAANDAIERAVADHELWRQRANVEMAKELQAADEDAAARGIFDSSIHIQNRAAIQEIYRLEREARFRHVLRVTHDAAEGLGPFERWTMKRKLARNGADEDSLEARIFGEAEM
jgi:hypothetical protein